MYKEGIHFERMRFYLNEPRRGVPHTFQLGSLYLGATDDESQSLQPAALSGCKLAHLPFSLKYGEPTRMPRCICWIQYHMALGINQNVIIAASHLIWARIWEGKTFKYVAHSAAGIDVSISLISCPHFNRRRIWLRSSATYSFQSLPVHALGLVHLIHNWWPQYR